MMNNSIFIFLAFIFGACIGSFLNVVILRLPREKKLTGRSHCAGCGRVLGPLDLIPVFSYLFLLGRCRACGINISPRYLIIELVAGVLFSFTAWFFYPASVNQAIVLAKILCLISVLIVVFVVDLEHYIILDSVLAFGAGLVLLLNFAIDIANKMPFWSWHNVFAGGLISALLCPLPFFLLWYFSAGKWMGFGDVKLAVFLGLALGWPLWPVGLMLSVFLGGAVGLALLASGTKGLKSRLPFGTFLSLGTLLTIFYGEIILRWYMSILGF